MADENKIIVGIDLGTTNTLACYFRKGKPDFIRFPGGKMLPSVLYVDTDGTLYVGKKASSKGVVDPKNEIRSSKTYMGDFSKVWNCNGKKFNATQAATEILKEVKRCIIKKMKCSEDAQIDAVITVPAYFNSNQTDETRKAGRAAGFNVMSIITEPMAAAIAAVTESELDKKIFVVDLGGGTFDLSVLEADQSTHSYRAIDIDGDRRLGGDDFDNMIKDYLLGIIEDDLGMDLSSYQAAGISESEYNSTIGRIRDAAAIAKEELSDDKETDIDINNLFSYEGKQYDLNISMTRDEFEEECKPLFDKIENRIKKFIANSDKFKLSDISTVVLAGGSCYIPKVREIVEAIFNKPVSTELEFSTLVAKGACFYADSGSSGMAINIQDVLSHSLGVEVVNEKGKNVLSKILNKGDAYPCTQTKMYTTSQDNQQVISVNVYEAASDCENIEDIAVHDFYGGFVLDGIAPAPKKVPQIEVSFSYDKSRCLTVKAVDKASGRSKQIEIRKGTKMDIKPQAEPIDFMLLMDTSGSMSGGGLDEAKEACYELLDKMIDLSTHRMGLIEFESRASKISDLTHDKVLLKDAVKNLKALYGSTNMSEAMSIAYSALSSSKNQKAVIIVTDGQPDSEPAALDAANRLKNAGIRVVTIGAGRFLSFPTLQKIASKDDAYKLDNMSELKKTFKEVISKLVER